MAKLNEDSEFTIPLKNIVGLVAFTVVAVWAYFGVIERITLLERDVLMLQEERSTRILVGLMSLWITFVEWIRFIAHNILYRRTMT